MLSGSRRPFVFVAIQFLRMSTSRGGNFKIVIYMEGTKTKKSPERSQEKRKTDERELPQMTTKKPRTKKPRNTSRKCKYAFGKFLVILTQQEKVFRRIFPAKDAKLEKRKSANMRTTLMNSGCPSGVRLHNHLLCRESKGFLQKVAFFCGSKVLLQF